MTCAKRLVTATVVAPSGERFVGTNYCDEPQVTCPRGEMPGGVGYELCREVCHQPAHAEINALRAAGDAAWGATIYVQHDWMCDACTHACFDAGVYQITLGAPPV